MSSNKKEAYLWYSAIKIADKTHIKKSVRIDMIKRLMGSKINEEQLRLLVKR